MTINRAKLLAEIEDTLAEDRARVEAGAPGALYQALAWCHDRARLLDLEDTVVLPRWLYDATLNLVRIHTMNTRMGSGKGHHARYERVCEQAMIDLSRYMAVVAARDAGKRGDAVWERAQELLLGKRAYAGCESIRRSYYRLRGRPPRRALKAAAPGRRVRQRRVTKA